MTLTISRTFTLQAAHHLPATPYDHKCHRVHGHTWSCRIFVTGPVHPNLMWIVDYADIDQVWTKNVFDVLDHTDLNERIPNPTTEAIVLWMYNAMAEPLAKLGAKLVRIELGEGDRNRCDLEVEFPAVEN